MTDQIDAKTLKRRLHDGAEIALLDVREHGQYGQAHLFYAISLPYSRLEIDAPRLVPRLDTPIVIYDDGGGSDDIALLAARRLTACAYSRISILTGGIAGWRDAGFELFQGVNVPSKTFGELVEQQRQTPVMTAQDLFARQRLNDNLIVLDGRPYEEFLKMSIPGAICCPNGELALRIGELAADPETTVVINCAGRTRSIIGAQTLIDLGIKNPVVALENGTQGWRLAGFELEQGNTRRHANSAPADIEQRRSQARRFAQANQVPSLDAAQAQAFASDATRSCFVLDVRSPEEYRHGTLAGAQLAPGGQLIQASDQYIGVRQARLLIVDDEGVRALVVAGWMRQLGFDAFTLADGVHTALQLQRAPAPTLPALETIDSNTLAKWLATRPVRLIDIRSSTRFRQQHLAGAEWSIRPRLRSMLAGTRQQIILIAEQYELAQLAAMDLADIGLSSPLVYVGPMQACRAAGMNTKPADSPASPGQDIDFLFFVHERHAGNLEASRRYLEWETGLLTQADRSELAAFSIRFPTRRASGPAR